MGTTDSKLDPSNELKVYRKVRAEYAHLRTQLKGQDLVDALEQCYDETVNATHPLRLNGDSGKWQCPKVRFGRTGIAMPIITCGGMRQQMTWRPKDGLTLEEVDKACQDNFAAIVERAMALGINHFETAKGYGCSELQYGACLKGYERSSYILQTKIRPYEDPNELRKALEESFAKLQVSYIDLFAFHGINTRALLDMTLNGGVFEVVDEYRKAGKIKWVGFSTHASADVIVDACNSGRFDYVNLHYHYVGSYHASGTWQGEGPLESGNLAALRAAQAQDMGVFIISPNDKGGMHYKPAKTLVDACRPQGLTPIAFNNLYLWSHNPPIHTLVVGAARPSDFDEACEGARLLDRAAELVSPVNEALQQKMAAAVGEQWLATWYKGLPGVYDTPTGIHVPHIVWLWNLMKGWGMYDYCRARYATLEGNLKNWKPELPLEENFLKAWSDFVPGLPYDAAKASQLELYLNDSPHKERVLAALAEAHEWLCEENEAAVRATAEERGWNAVCDLQVDVPFPERK